MDYNDIYIKTLLYDFYGELLNDHKNDVYSKFLNEDLTLTELAKEKNISRQGIFDLVSKTEKSLIEYESKLHLIEKYLDNQKKLKTILNQLENNNIEKAIVDIKELINII